MDRTAAFYSGPSYRGSGFPVYAGSRRQRGGSILGAIKKTVLPALGNVAGKVGTKILSNGIGLAGDVAGDVLLGRQSFSKSLKHHGLKRLKNIGREGLGDVIGSVASRVTPSRKRPAGNNLRKVSKKKRARRGLF